MTTALQVVVVLFLLYSCSGSETEHIEAVLDRSAMPKLHAMDVKTVVSDSGITRYRINTPQWDMFDRASRPYWEFPLGIHLERFDEKLKVDANIHADYAKYLEQEQLWELKGTVRATNIQGELFETEQLFWDQRSEKIYSDSLIKITQANYIIIGTGFESNQVMTKYEVRNT
ncbi:MAG: LPS export ABC transporter periplasmic protein LptC, partial [Pedobacter sp.]|nr:LPS export ABC transporter periplasmic protein LptC [Pedobacter sp.]